MRIIGCPFKEIRNKRERGCNPSPTEDYKLQINFPLTFILSPLGRGDTKKLLFIE
jgi:hypothetical protein